MIDIDGYRANVGIIVCNEQGQVMWAKRLNQDAWQFPQGGIDANEDATTAMYRELWEETGLKSEHVIVLRETESWYRYKIPKRMIRHNSTPICIGQKQKWFLLQLQTSESDVDLFATKKPEFDHWKWVDFWLPAKEVVSFKRRAYQCALSELQRFLPV